MRNNCIYKYFFCNKKQMTINNDSHLFFVAEARFERASSGYEPDEIPLLHSAILNVNVYYIE